MSQDYTYIIQTSKNGILDSVTPRVHVERLVQRAVASGRPIVIHLHGGLVKKENAYETVNDVQPVYHKEGMFPIFMVWRTGLFDALKNIDEAVKKPLVKKLQERLLRFLVGKFGDNTAKSRGESGMPPPDEAQIEAELARQETGGEPYAWVHPEPTEEGLSDEEIQFLAGEIQQDDTLLHAWDQEVKEALTPEQKSGATLNESVAKEAAETRTGPTSKSIFDMGLVTKHAITIAARVIWRFYQKRDHGLHATVIEEILRTLYIDSIGTSVWQMMKTDSQDTFERADTLPERGGWLLMKLLGDAFLAAKNAGKPLPAFSIVGHSAGSIYASHLLQHLRREQQRSGSAWSQLPHPVQKLIFLAPAITHRLFVKTLQIYQPQLPFQDFRMFTLSDQAERGYYEVPILYPGSLLYIISGLLESKDDQKTADMPLVGMQRYDRNNPLFTDDGVTEVRLFLRGHVDRIVYSGQNRGPGLHCDSERHGSFGQAGTGTMASIIHFLKS